MLVVAAVAALASFPAPTRDDFHTDEGMWIYVAQKTWALARDGRWDDPAWESLDSSWGYPNPPVSKIALGASLAAQRAEWQWVSGTAPPDAVLVAARRPSRWLGLLGAVALCLVGMRALGSTTGLLAGLLLAASPLWIWVSRHAMTDVYGAAPGIASVAAFVPLLRELRGRGRWPAVAAWAAASGILAGLAVGSKLNAACVPAAVGTLLLLELGASLLRGDRRSFRASRVLVAGVLFAAFATAVFVGSNPFLHEDAPARFGRMVAFWSQMNEQRAARGADGFGNAFLPMERGVRIMAGKLLFPPKPAAWFLAAAIAVGVLPRWIRPGAARAGRLTGWVLLVPATLVAGSDSNQIAHGWIAWLGVVGTIIALAGSVPGERGSAAARWLVPIWTVVAAFFVWRTTFTAVTRYYLPILPPLTLAAAWALAALRRDASAGGPWPRRLVDAGVAAGLLSVILAAPGEHAAVEAMLHEAPAAARAAHWVAVVAVAAGAVLALRRAPTVSPPAAAP